MEMKTSRQTSSAFHVIYNKMNNKQLWQWNVIHLTIFFSEVSFAVGGDGWIVVGLWAFFPEKCLFVFRRHSWRRTIFHMSTVLVFRGTAVIRPKRWMEEWHKMTLIVMFQMFRMFQFELQKRSKANNYEAKKLGIL